MATRPSFPLRAVAALFLKRQHLDRPRTRKLTRQNVVRFASDTGGIQIDSINVVDRAHYLTVWSRFGQYDRTALDRIVYARRALFEYWAHAACLISAEHFPAWRRAMLDYSTRSRAWGTWLKKNQALVEEVAQAITAQGPLGNSDFQAGVRRRSGGWWNWKPATYALDYLWMSGRTLIHSRAHFQKRFDLAERVMPEAAREAPLSAAEFRRWHVRQSLHAMGAATSLDLRRYLTFPRASAIAQRSVLAELVASGEVLEIDVRDEGTAKAVPWYVLARDARALRVSADVDAPSRGTTILTPFDSFLWHRERSARLFGFDYKIEVYTPGHARVHGYYVLPILHDGQLIGRLDAKNHRAERRLEAKRIHFEPWFAGRQAPPRGSFGALDRERAFAGVAGALNDLGAFLGTDEVTVAAVEPRPLAAPFARAHKSLR